MADKPRSREKHVTGNGTGLYRRGEGLNQSAPTSGSSAPHPQGGNNGGGRRDPGERGLISSLGGKAPIVLILLALLVFGGKSGFLSSFLGGSGLTDDSYTET